MKRVTRRRRNQERRKIRLYFLLSGGLLTIIVLVMGFIWVGKNPLGIRITDSLLEDDEFNKPGQFVFYEALKETGTDGGKFPPLIPKSSEPNRTKKPKPLTESLAGGGKFKSTIYTVQVAAYKEKVEAQAMINRLLQKGYPAYLEAQSIPGKGLWFRVRIGHFRDKEKARRLAAQVSSREQLEGFIAIEKQL